MDAFVHNFVSAATAEVQRKPKNMFNSHRYITAKKDTDWGGKYELKPNRGANNAHTRGDDALVSKTYRMAHRSLLTPLDTLHSPDGSSATFLVLLFFLLMFLHFYDEIPPVTLAIMATHLTVHKRLWPVFNVKLLDVCMDTLLVWNREQWYRILVAPFYHANDYHLGFTLLSFFVKGTILEEYFGSYIFFLFVVVIAILVNIITIPMSFVFEFYLQDPSFISRCTIGFSGVVFALKVIATLLFPRGMVSSWIELPVLCMLMPKLTCVANFSGIVVGLMVVILIRRITRYQCRGRGSDNDPDFFYWYQEDRGTWPDPLGGLLWPFGRTRRPTVRRPTRQPHFVYDSENTYLIEEGRSPPPTWLELFSGNRVSLPPSPQFIRRVGGRRPAPRRRRCNSCNR
ncbi:Rhomboid-related protein 4 [Lamellibrachia satsuma]|nr:Rhomboid-related protein 4 [Lamellibrachia satsuma]